MTTKKLNRVLSIAVVAFAVAVLLAVSSMAAYGYNIDGTVSGLEEGVDYTYAKYDFYADAYYGEFTALTDSTQLDVGVYGIKAGENDPEIFWAYGAEAGQVNFWDFDTNKPSISTIKSDEIVKGKWSYAKDGAIEYLATGDYRGSDGTTTVVLGIDKSRFLTPVTEEVEVQKTVTVENTEYPVYLIGETEYYLNGEAYYAVAGNTLFEGDAAGATAVMTTKTQQTATPWANAQPIEGEGNKLNESIVRYGLTDAQIIPAKNVNSFLAERGPTVVTGGLKLNTGYSSADLKGTFTFVVKVPGVAQPEKYVVNINPTMKEYVVPEAMKNSNGYLVGIEYAPYINAPEDILVGNPNDGKAIKCYGHIYFFPESTNGMTTENIPTWEAPTGITGGYGMIGVPDDADYEVAPLLLNAAGDALELGSWEAYDAVNGVYVGLCAVRQVCDGRATDYTMVYVYGYDSDRKNLGKLAVSTGGNKTQEVVVSKGFGGSEPSFVPGAWAVEYASMYGGAGYNSWAVWNTGSNIPDSSYMTRFSNAKAAIERLNPSEATITAAQTAVTTAETALETAQADLAAKEATLAELKNAETPDEVAIAAAEADVTAAQTAVTTAETNRNAAKADLTELQNNADDPDEEAIAAEEAKLLAAQTYLAKHLNNSVHRYAYESDEIIKTSELNSFTFTAGVRWKQVVTDHLAAKVLVYVADENGEVKPYDHIFADVAYANSVTYTIDFTSFLPEEGYVVGLEIWPYYNIEPEDVIQCQPAGSHAILLTVNPANYSIDAAPERPVYGDAPKAEGYLGVIAGLKANAVYDIAPVTINTTGDGISVGDWEKYDASKTDYVGLYAIRQCFADHVSELGYVYVHGSQSGRQNLFQIDASTNRVAVKSSSQKFVPGYWTNGRQTDIATHSSFGKWTLGTLGGHTGETQQRAVNTAYLALKELAPSDADIAAAQTAVTTAETALATAQTDLAAKEATLAELKNAETPDEAAIATAEADVTAAQTAVTTAETNLATAKADLAELQNIVANPDEAAIATAKADLLKAQTTIANAMNKVSYIYAFASDEIIQTSEAKSISVSLNQNNAWACIKYERMKFIAYVVDENGNLLEPIEYVATRTRVNSSGTYSYGETANVINLEALLPDEGYLVAIEIFPSADIKPEEVLAHSTVGCTGYGNQRYIVTVDPTNYVIDQYELPLKGDAPQGIKYEDGVVSGLKASETYQYATINIHGVAEWNEISGATSFEYDFKGLLAVRYKGDGNTFICPSTILYYPGTITERSNIIHTTSKTATGREGKNANFGKTMDVINVASSGGWDTHSYVAGKWTGMTLSNELWNSYGFDPLILGTTETPLGTKGNSNYNNGDYNGAALVRDYISKVYYAYEYLPEEIIPMEEFVSFTYKPNTRQTNLSVTAGKIKTVFMLWIVKEDGQLVSRRVEKVNNMVKDKGESVTITLDDFAETDGYIVGIEILPFGACTEDIAFKTGTTASDFCVYLYKNSYVADPQGVPVETPNLTIKDGVVTGFVSGKTYEVASYDISGYGKWTTLEDGITEYTLENVGLTAIRTAAYDVYNPSISTIFYKASTNDERAAIGNYQKATHEKKGEYDQAVYLNDNLFVVGSLTGTHLSYVSDIDGVAAFPGSTMRFLDQQVGGLTNSGMEGNTKLWLLTHTKDEANQILKDEKNHEDEYGTTAGGAYNPETLQAEIDKFYAVENRDVAAELAALRETMAKAWVTSNLKYAFDATEILPVDELITIKFGANQRQGGAKFNAKAKVVFHVADNEGKIETVEWFSEEYLSTTYRKTFTVDVQSIEGLPTEGWIVGVEFYPYGVVDPSSIVPNVARIAQNYLSYSFLQNHVIMALVDTEYKTVPVEPYASETPTITINKATLTVTNYDEDADYAYSTDNGETWTPFEGNTVTVSKANTGYTVKVLGNRFYVESTPSETVTSDAFIVVGTSLILDGQIGTKVHFAIDEDVINKDSFELSVTRVNADYSYIGEYKAPYKIQGTATATSGNAWLSKLTYDEKNDLYYVVFYTPAKDADNLHLETDLYYKLVGAEEKTRYGSIGINFKVTNYIAAAKELAAAGDETFEAALPVVEALETYVAYADNYFGDKTDAEYVSEALTDTVISESTKTGTLEGLSFYGTSLVLEENVTIRHYFLVTDPDAYAAAGYAAATGTSGNYVYYDITDIAAQDLGEAKELTLKATSGAEFTVSYSAVDYVVSMKNDSEVSLKSLVNAMYDYYVEAKAYFTKNAQ